MFIFPPFAKGFFDGSLWEEIRAGWVCWGHQYLYLQRQSYKMWSRDSGYEVQVQRSYSLALFCIRASNAPGNHSHYLVEKDKYFDKVGFRDISCHVEFLISFCLGPSFGLVSKEPHHHHSLVLEKETNITNIKFGTVIATYGHVFCLARIFFLIGLACASLGGWGTLWQNTKPVDNRLCQQPWQVSYMAQYVSILDWLALLLQ